MNEWILIQHSENGRGMFIYIYIHYNRGRSHRGGIYGMTPLLRVTISRGRKFVFRWVFSVPNKRSVCGVPIPLHNLAFLPQGGNMAETLPLLPISTYWAKNKLGFALPFPSYCVEFKGVNFDNWQVNSYVCLSVCSHKYNEAWSTLSVKQNTHMLSSTFSIIILSCLDVTRVCIKARVTWRKL